MAAAARMSTHRQPRGPRPRHKRRQVVRQMPLRWLGGRSAHARGPACRRYAQRRGTRRSRWAACLPEPWARRMMTPCSRLSHAAPLQVRNNNGEGRTVRIGARHILELVAQRDWCVSMIVASTEIIGNARAATEKGQEEKWYL